MSDSANLGFLSWMRRGLGRAMQPADSGGIPQAMAGEVALSVSVEAGSASTAVGKTLGMRSPADVAGLHAHQIVRCDPPEGTRDFEPNYFPAVELLTPDLPWMFTPASASSGDRLVPWIALVVVEVTEGVSLSDMQRLKIEDPASVAAQLPDLTEAWAWAHVQSTADLGSTSLEDAFRSRPEDFRARLVCPRRLDPHTSYLAAIVPTFEDGRRIGLGLTPREEVDTSDPDWWKAWTPDASSVELPVYHSWSFRTGEEGDFESLVRRLVPRELEAGTKPFDIGQSGSTQLPPQPVKRKLVSWKGALVSPAAEEIKKDRDHWDDFRTSLGSLVEDGMELSEPADDETYAPLSHDPVVGPPAYGALAVEAEELPDVRTKGERLQRRHAPLWLADVNTDPIHRSAAGLGAEVVRRDQEALMASAWQQATSLRAINRLLNRTRLAADVGRRRVSEKLSRLSDASLLNFCGPASKRLQLSGQKTLAGRVVESNLPIGLGTSALARVARPQGPLGRAMRGVAEFTVNPSTYLTSTCLAQPVSSMAHASFVRPSGIQIDAEVAKTGIPGAAETTEPARERRMRSRRVEGTRARGELAGVRARLMPAAFSAGEAWEPTLDRRVIDPGAVFTPEATSETASLATAIRSAMRPVAALSAKLESRITAPGFRIQGGVIPTRIHADPQFPFALYERLCAISPEFLLAGVGDVPADTVGLTEVNAAFVEAFLLGANEELSREFAWREYPALLSDTWLRCFWDALPAEGEDPDAVLEDIEPVANWDRGPWRRSALGKHQVGAAADGSLVLIVRSELWRKYPDTAIYATKAVWADDGTRRVEAVDGDGASLERHDPLFFGVLDDQTMFLGFSFKEEDALGEVDEQGYPLPGADGDDAGLFFVFEEEPTGTRFGLDIGQETQSGKNADRSPRYWRDLSWYHQVEDAGDLAGLAHAAAEGRFSGSSARRFDPSGDPSAATFRETWGTTAAAMARITYQRPVRVLVHASAMLPEDG